MADGGLSLFLFAGLNFISSGKESTQIPGVVNSSGDSENFDSMQVCITH